MRYGTLDTQGALYSGEFQLIHEHQVPSIGLDTWTKTLMHMQGLDQGTTFTEETGKTVTNTEAYDSYNKLMLHLENNVTDSAAAKVVTNNNVTFSSTVYKMGAYSGYFNGTTAYLTVPTGADWNMGSGDFTIDFWVQKATDGTFQGVIGQCSNTASNYSFMTRINDTNKLETFLNTTGLLYALSTGTITGTGWHHVAIVRYGNTVTQYIDGTADGKADVTGISLYSSGEPLTIGRLGTFNSQYFNGYLDEIRVCKGVARWISNFVPPSAPYGKVATSTQNSPKFGGASAVFDGGGSYLSMADSADWDWQALDWTVECWLKTYSTLTRIILMRNGPGYYSFGFFMNSDGTIYSASFNPTGSVTNFVIYGTKVVSNGAWHHVAVVRNGNNITQYVDGKSDATTTFTGTIEDAATGFRIGVDTDGAYAFNGWLDEFRISKGIARWKTDFTPPTLPYDGVLTKLYLRGDAVADATGKTVTNTETYDTYTKLMLHLENNVTDSTGGNTPVNNNVTFSSTTYKMGAYSGVFDGSTAYVSVPDSASWTFGTGDFTIDYWVNYSSLPTAYIGGFGQAHDTDNYWIMEQYGKDYLYFYAKNLATVKMGYYVSSANLQTGVWYHIAWVRNGSNFYLFINGVSQTLTVAAAIDGNSLDDIGVYALTVGRCLNDSGTGYNYLNGYIDEFRISKGIARWTANFTPPTNAYGTVGTTPSFYKFNEVGASLAFDGSGSSLSLADTDDWWFGSGDFTIDAWIKKSRDGVDMGICNQHDGSTFSGSEFTWFIDASTNTMAVAVYWGPISPNYTYFYTIQTITGTAWHHVALVRSGGTLKIYIDGIADAITGDITGKSLNNPATPLGVGIHYPLFGYFNGWIAGLRVSKGIARWTSNFTPPLYGEYGGALTNYHITGLDGNTDLEYKMIVRTVSGAASQVTLLRLNNDSATNYGYQYMRGTAATTTGANRGSQAKFYGTYDSSNAGAIAQQEWDMYVKSGTIRTSFMNGLSAASGAAVSGVTGVADVWNNTIDNVTSIDIPQNQINGIGVGSHIFLFARKYLGSTALLGTKTGEIDLYGSAKAGVFQKVHEKFIDDYTKLLLHLDNGVVDSAKNATVTNTNVTFSTTSKFGGYSGLFNGTTAYLTVPDSADWYVGTSDFTIDCWIRLTSVPAASAIVSQENIVNPSLNFWMWRIQTAGMAFFSYTAGDEQGDFFGSFSWATNTWYHIVVERYGSTCKMFVNGVSLVVTQTDPWGTIINSDGALHIGYYANASYYFPGYIDEFRISKGIARWTTRFTPPTQSYDCTLDTQTKLLMHGGGSNGGTTFYDNSINKRTIATNGNTQYDTGTYKLRASSIKFDGNSDFLAVPDSPDWYFATGAFTVEFWVKWNVNTYMTVSQGNGGSDRVWFFIYLGGAGVLSCKTSAWTINFQCSISPNLNLNQWYHVAFVRIDNANASTSWKIFVDGVNLDNFTLYYGAWNAEISDITTDLRIGTTDGVGDWFNGWIEELRISKGIARWTSDFSSNLPSAPYDSPLNQYIIDGLDGDTDTLYGLETFLVNGSASNTPLMLELNSDSGSNFGSMYLAGLAGVASAAQNSSRAWVVLCNGTSSGVGATGHFSGIIYGKSGYLRTVLGVKSINTLGTTSGGFELEGSSWNNDANNLKSMRFDSNGVNNGLGVGTKIRLYSLRRKSS